jgi:hypothetical protein
MMWFRACFWREKNASHYNLSMTPHYPALEALTLSTLRQLPANRWLSVDGVVRAISAGVAPNSASVALRALLARGEVVRMAVRRPTPGRPLYIYRASK